MNFRLELFFIYDTIREHLTNAWKKWETKTILLTFLIYFPFVNYVEFQHVGLARNFVTGEMYLQRPGTYITEPWVSVARIDARPVRVCLQSSSIRTTTCKLVRFVPKYYREFVANEGHRYYWLSNRFSYNSGYEHEYRGMQDLLRGYAFMPTEHFFIAEEREY